MNKQPQIDTTRSAYYTLFANFFSGSQDIGEYFSLLNLLQTLNQAALDEKGQKAFEAILDKIDNDSNVTLLQEFDDIFHNPQTTTIPTSASFYDEGIESGQKRVQMLQFVAKTPIRRNEEHFSEYEDSIAFIFALLAQLTHFTAEGKNEYDNTVHCIIEQVLNEFVEDFSQAVFEHESADIYKDVIVLLHGFMEFERLYLDIAPAKPKPVEEVAEPEISQEEKERRARNKALKAKGPKGGEQEACPVDIAYDVEDNIKL
ncbi:MAG: TorD/DmsD family molecular chaperone [Campylobacterota bacterium]